MLDVSTMLADWIFTLVDFWIWHAIIYHPKLSSWLLETPSVLWASHSPCASLFTTKDYNTVLQALRVLSKMLKRKVIQISLSHIQFLLDLSCCSDNIKIVGSSQHKLLKFSECLTKFSIKLKKNILFFEQRKQGRKFSIALTILPSSEIWVAC